MPLAMHRTLRVLHFSINKSSCSTKSGELFRQMNYDSFASPRGLGLSTCFSSLKSADFMIKMFRSASIGFRIGHERFETKRKLCRKAQHRKPEIEEIQKNKIYGEAFLIGLINFLVASSCWHFLFLFLSIHDQTRQRYEKKVL